MTAPTPGNDARDDLVRELWAERHDGTWWRASFHTTPATPARTHADEERELPTADEYLSRIPIADDLTIARRRKVLNDSYDHIDPEKEAL